MVQLYDGAKAIQIPQKSYFAFWIWTFSQASYIQYHPREMLGRSARYSFKSARKSWGEAIFHSVPSCLAVRLLSKLELFDAFFFIWYFKINSKPAWNKPWHTNWEASKVKHAQKINYRRWEEHSPEAKWAHQERQKQWWHRHWFQPLLSSSLQPGERTVSSTTGTGLGREKEGEEAATEAKHVWHCRKYTC